MTPVCHLRFKFKFKLELQARAFKVLRAELFFMATFQKFRSFIQCFFLVRFHDQQFFFQAKVTRSSTGDVCRDTFNNRPFDGK